MESGISQFQKMLDLVQKLRSRFCAKSYSYPLVYGKGLNGVRQPQSRTPSKKMNGWATCHLPHLRIKLGIVCDRCESTSTYVYVCMDVHKCTTLPTPQQDHDPTRVFKKTIIIYMEKRGLLLGLPSGMSKSFSPPPPPPPPLPHTVAVPSIGSAKDFRIYPTRHFGFKRS